MDWKQETNWYMQSAEGYRISKATSACPGQYAAWAPGSKAEHPAIGYAARLDQAKQICEEHFNNQRSAT